MNRKPRREGRINGKWKQHPTPEARAIRTLLDSTQLYLQSTRKGSIYLLRKHYYKSQYHDSSTGLQIKDGWYSLRIEKAAPARKLILRRQTNKTRAARTLHVRRYRRRQSRAVSLSSGIDKSLWPCKHALSLSLSLSLSLPWNIDVTGLIPFLFSTGKTGGNGHFLLFRSN